jgi:hypothetical protein
MDPTDQTETASEIWFYSTSVFTVFIFLVDIMVKDRTASDTNSMAESVAPLM